MNHTDTPSQPVAIIGLGCLFAGAGGVTPYWRMLFQGKDAIAEVPDTHWSAEDYYSPDPKTPDHVYCKRGGFLSPIDFDPTEFGIPPNLLQATDTSQLLSLVVARAALRNAGYLGSGRCDHGKTAVILGATGTQELAVPLGARLGHPHWRRALMAAGVAPETVETVMRGISDAYVPWEENSFPGLLGNVIAGRISNRLDLGGTNCVVDAACASSLSAVHLAVMELETGRADMALTGGVDLLNDIFMHMCFSRTGILSPSGDIRPFSKSADGILLGEGVGMLLLKRLSDAQRDTDRIYAVIKGIGTSSDGKSQSIYSPRSEGQQQALQTAYQRAGMSPATVRMVEAHGTGTRVGDEVEFKTLRRVFEGAGAAPRQCAIGSVKSMIGHCKAAAGSAGLIKTVLALHHKVLPPTLKAEDPDPRLDISTSPFYLSDKARPWFGTGSHPRRAGVSSFGFGGSNFHVVLEEYQTEKPEPAWDGSVQIFALSAESIETLSDRAKDLLAQLVDAEDGEEAVAYAACLSRKAFCPTSPFRLLLRTTSDADAGHAAQAPKQQLSSVCAALDETDTDRLCAIPGVFYGTGPCPGKISFLFPGQGSQYVNMAREWFCLFPEAFKAMEHANAAFCKAGNAPLLSDMIFPPPAMDRKEKQAQEAALRRTEVAQPALGAVSTAMARVMGRFGIVPDVACGHSFGELSALCTAGWIGADALFELAVARGRCMASAGHESGRETGGMLAVIGPLEDVSRHLKETNLPLVIANRNSPTQSVLSGPAAAIEAARKHFNGAGLTAIPLSVSAAFHTARMAEARKPFAKSLDTVEVHPTDVPVLSNVTGSRHEGFADKARKLLKDQLVSPVLFYENLKALYADGVRTFIEIGPQQVLTGLVKESFDREDILALGLDVFPARGSAITHLADVLCRLAAAGHPVRLDQWEYQTPEPAKKRMRIPLTGANYRAASSSASHPQPVAPVPMDSPLQVMPVAPTPASTGTATLSPQNSPPTFGAEQPYFSTQIESSAMHKTHPLPETIARAFQVAEEGLRSMQALQQQTADAHQKFLDTQAQAARALQDMINATRAFAGNDVPADPSGPAARISPYAVSLPKNTTADVPPTASAFPSKPVAAPSFPPPPEDGTSSSHSRTSTESQVAETLLSVVSDLTGYPREMLGMDMDIESDLGIDSIKRVEILSAMEEKVPGLPPVTPDMMGSLNTLGKILAHFESVENTAVDTSAVPEKPHAAPGSSAPEGTLQQNLLAVVSDLTGYPREMLGMDMDIESDLGIDSIKRVEILSAMEEKVPGLPPVTPDMMGSLNTLGKILAHFDSVENTAVDTSAVPEKPHAAPGSSAPEGTVQQNLLTVVSDLTGYPREMLGMDMDIESDLGIDSIKRVEILSAMEEKMPELPSVSPEMLGTLNTLGKIIAYLSGGSTEKAAATGTDPGIGLLPSVSPESESPKRFRIVPTAEPISSDPVALTDKFSRPIYITDDTTGLSHAMAEKWRALGVACHVIPWPDLKDIQGRKFCMEEAGGLILVPTPTDFSDNGRRPKDLDRLQAAFALARHAGPCLKTAATSGSAVFATVVRINGTFGFGTPVGAAPMAGALSGLSKTAASEWPGVVCRAIDVDPAWDATDDIAARLVAVLADAREDAPLEIGIGKDSQIRLCLSEAALPATPPAESNRLTKDSVIVISGGGRGVTAEVAKALARYCVPRIVLLGRSPAPTPEPEWLSRLSCHREIRKAILTNVFPDEKPRPKLVEAEFHRRMANREVAATLWALNENGARAVYIPVDIRDEAAVRRVLDAVRTDFGPVTGLVHGAGVLEDRWIVDKTDEQVARVLDTKIRGLQNLLDATDQDPLSFAVMFSSVAARFGNVGQADYAMANEALNKMAARLGSERPGCKVTAINWGPWDGGMVDDTLKREFSRRGIDLIRIDTGATMFINELLHDCDDHEVVIGALLESGGEAESNNTDTSLLRVTLNRNIDPSQFPILSSHRLDGKPVVPFALLTEWVGHSALHENPGLLLQAVEDMRLLKGIRLSEGGKMIRVLSGKAQKTGDAYVVDVEIRNGIQDVREVLHSRAKVVLTDRLAPAPVFDSGKLSALPPYAKSIREVYETILFHGHLLQGIRRIIGLSDKGMAAEVAPAPPPEQWMAAPMRSQWIADPLVLDSAFQMACVWCYEQKGMVSLPSFVASYRQYCRKFPRHPVTAVLEVTRTSERKMTGNFTFLDDQGRVAAELLGYEATMNETLFKAFKPDLAKSA